MKRILRFLFNGYGKMPYFFFAVLAGCWCYSLAFMKGVNWKNDGYERHFPILSAMSVATTSLMLLFPAVAVSLLIYNYRLWRRLIPALISYSLYLCFLLLAAYMHWWVD